MITIDYDKCIGCLSCIPVCPFRVLAEAGGKPETVQEAYCIKCLHCAAACQQDAIMLGGLEGVLPGEMPAFSEEFPELLKDFLMTRRSYRNFQPTPVPKDLIDASLHAAAWAPSAKNQHPTEWIVISDENPIAAIMNLILDFVRETGVSPEIAKLYEQGHNVVMGNAKTLLIAYSRTNAINPPVDTALALCYAELYLQSRGVGTCWAGYLTRMCNQVSGIREMLRIPEGCQVYGALMLGFPADNEKYIRIPNREKQPQVRWL